MRPNMRTRTFCSGSTLACMGLTARVRRYNSALLLTPKGDAVARYDKMHLVPFGEYIPLKDVFPFVRQFSPYGDNDYTISPGAEQTRFPLTVAGRTYHFGVLICYEDVVASLARRLVEPSEQPPIDFLVNISNDGWFMGSAEHAEHLAVSRFRAIECRRTLLRAVNGGISAVVDGCGRIVAVPDESWAKSHSLTAVLTAAVPLDTRQHLRPPRRLVAVDLLRTAHCRLLVAAEVTVKSVG